VAGKSLGKEGGKKKAEGIRIRKGEGDQGWRDKT